MRALAGLPPDDLWANFRMNVMGLPSAVGYDASNGNRKGVCVMASASNWTEIVTALGSAVLSLSVGMIWWQVREAKAQAQTQFEDLLEQEFRRIVTLIPVSLRLGKIPTETELIDALPAIVAYFELTNTQARLWKSRRIRRETWVTWVRGIKRIFRLPAFRIAWETLRLDSHDGLGNLKAIKQEWQ